MSKYTKQERHEIYKEAKRVHVADIEFSKRHNFNIDGMCFNLSQSLMNLNHESIFTKHDEILDLLPEFLQLKPKNKNKLGFWWIRKNSSTIRIKNYDLIIEQTKP